MKRPTQGRNAHPRAFQVERWIRSALRSADGREPEVGRVSKLGEGLSRDVFVVEVTSAGRTEPLVLLMPRGPDADRDRRTRKEAELLGRLATLQLPFRVPRSVALVPTENGLAWICTYEEGLSLDRWRDNPLTPRWVRVAEIAAAVHAIPVDALGEIEGHATRRAHGEEALARLAEFEGDEELSVRAALAWLHENLPPDEPSSLLHGDLLGQNILVPVFDPSVPPALIDWEYARLGDPAHDLAIVTRGVRKPFGNPRGLALLLEAYLKTSPRPLLAREVRFHELCLALDWYRDPEHPDGPEQHLHRIENLLAWARR